MKTTRRHFLATLGTSAAGSLLTPLLGRARDLTGEYLTAFSPLVPVALVRAASYDRALVKQNVQDLFESLGGITGLMRPGKKVAIKLNMTGGSGSSDSSSLQGTPITEAMWTHPEVVRAVTELIIDCGVAPADISFVEALWDWASFADFGYQTVQKNLGVNMVNLNARDPYADYVDLPVGDKKFFYSSFRVNGILGETDVYVSIPKMKEHFEAGVTASLKNQIGMVPKDLYILPSDQGRRGALHGEGGPSSTHLPRSVCDLNLARPVHLAVIDGIKNARGGEGVWNPTFRLAEDHVLIAGMEPVAADSIAACLMGHDPQAATITLPAGGTCDNYLSLLHDRGVGTNQLAEIRPVGNGADLVTSVAPGRTPASPHTYQLCQNYPNPFNPSTRITFSLPSVSDVTLRVLTLTGQQVDLLVQGTLPGGIHQVQWVPRGLASGFYFCELRAGSFAGRAKMIYQK